VETENFQDFVMPKPNPQPSPVAKGDPSPFAPPSTSLLAPPPGQTASVNSYPADDPAQQKATTKRIKTLLETLNGFINNEGPSLSQLGDPAVQIPLQTARADARRLTDEVSVLDRNPGVESTLSEMNVYDIEANLTYLQKKWRLSANSMSGTVEGFQSPSGGVPTSTLVVSPSGSPYHYKREISDFTKLPTTNNTVNDYYAILSRGSPFLWQTYALWNGSTWQLQGLPEYRVADVLNDITELSAMTYDDLLEGSVYKMKNNVGPYKFYLVWLGGAPGPVSSTPQDIINMISGLTVSSPAMSKTFTFVATTSSININTLIQNILKSPINSRGAYKGNAQRITELPSSNNLDSDSYGIPLTSTFSFQAIWLANCWVGKVVWPGMEAEGFQNPSGSTALPAQLITILNNLVNPRSPSGNPSGNPSGSPTITIPSTIPASSGPSGTSGPSPSGTPSGKGISDSSSITFAQLNTLQVNISATITRLTASGSTNPLLQQRINVLEKVLHEVNTYITQVNRGTLKPDDIPISVGSYNKFLPFVDPTKSLNINDPLPNLIATTGASPALSNLFPYLFGGDVSGADLARSLFEKYAKSFFTDTSYEIGLKFNHKSDSERRIAENIAKAALNPLNNSYGSDSDDYYESELRKDGSTHGDAPKPSGGRGETESRTTTLSGSTDGKTSNSNVSTSADPGAASSTPATMDWKARSEQICSQITKRGLNPNDYGCLKNPRDVDENFSFRGHARMVCSRLGTHYDPGIPDLCGCPPPTWPGWRP